MQYLVYLVIVVFLHSTNGKPVSKDVFKKASLEKQLIQQKFHVVDLGRAHVRHFRTEAVNDLTDAASESVNGFTAAETDDPAEDSTHSTIRTADEISEEEEGSSNTLPTEENSTESFVSEATSGPSDVWTDLNTDVAAETTTEAAGTTPTATEEEVTEHFSTTHEETDVPVDITEAANTDAPDETSEAALESITSEEPAETEEVTLETSSTTIETTFVSVSETDSVATTLTEGATTAESSVVTNGPEETETSTAAASTTAAGMEEFSTEDHQTTLMMDHTDGDTTMSTEGATTVEIVIGMTGQEQTETSTSAALETTGGEEEATEQQTDHPETTSLLDIATEEVTESNKPVEPWSPEATTWVLVLTTTDLQFTSANTSGSSQQTNEPVTETQAMSEVLSIRTSAASFPTTATIKNETITPNQSHTMTTVLPVSSTERSFPTLTTETNASTVIGGFETNEASVATADSIGTAATNVTGLPILETTMKDNAGGRIGFSSAFFVTMVLLSFT